MPNFVAVSSSAHKDLKVTEDRAFSHAKSQHIAPLVVHEFSLAAQEYPIIFVKDPTSDQHRAVALLGIKQGQNLFYDDKRWKVDYVPESLLGYPFVIAPDKNNKDAHILVMDDESSRLIKKSEGTDRVSKDLFDDEGKQSEFLVNTGKFLSELLGKQHQTQAFIKKLVELNLIIKQTLEVVVEGQEKVNIDGLYIIDEKALNEVSDKDYKELRKLGYIGPIYASLLSMNRIGSLVKMANTNHQKEN